MFNINDYKLFFQKAIKFIVILLIFDFIVGTIAKRIYFNQKTGKQARITYSIYKASDEILIFGSSHAARHYIPKIFEKALNQTCYNVGIQGQKILFHSVLEKIILKRTKPKLIILNVDNNWLYKSNEAYDRLHDLYPYYWEFRDIMKPTFELRSKLIDIQLFFKSYQFNSTIIHAVKYFFFPQKDFKGYVPLHGEVKNTKALSLYNDENEDTSSKEIDDNFVMAFKSFIHIAKANNINLLLITTPDLYPTNILNNKSLILMKKIAKEENITFWDFNNNEEFIYKFNLFHDPSHLNDKGAHLFSSIIANLIIEREKTLYSNAK